MVCFFVIHYDVLPAVAGAETTRIRKCRGAAFKPWNIPEAAFTCGDGKLVLKGDISVFPCPALSEILMRVFT